MFSQLMDCLFGPLKSSKWCNFYYVIEIISFVVMVVLAIVMIRAFNHMSKSQFDRGIYLMISSIMAYIGNRILYTMCVNNI